MAAALGVRQDTISRLEKRSDMLLSTMRQYVESMGGQLELVAKFPDRPPVVINHIGVKRICQRPFCKAFFKQPLLWGPAQGCF